MRDRVSLVTHEVVQAVRRVGVDEAVSNPLSGPNRLFDGRDELESRLNTIFIGFSVVQAVDVVLAREAEDVEVVFTGKSDQLSRFGPVNL